MTGTGNELQVIIQANIASPTEKYVECLFPNAGLAALAIITPAVVVKPIAVAAVVTGAAIVVTTEATAVATVVVAAPVPVTVTVLYPPLCAGGVVCVAYVVWIVCVACMVWIVCVICVVGAAVIVTPVPLHIWPAWQQATAP